MRLSTKDYDYIQKLVEEMYDNRRIVDDFVSRIISNEYELDFYSSKKRGEMLSEMDRTELLRLLLSMLANSVHKKGAYWND